MLSLIFFIFISAYAGVDFRYFFRLGLLTLPFPPSTLPPPPLWALANESYASAGSSCFIGIIFFNVQSSWISKFFADELINADIA